jgi:hypothetical protein
MVRSPQPRRPRVTPLRGTHHASEPAHGYVSLAQTEAGMNVAERRRLRRLRKIAESSTAPAAVPRNLPRRVYVSTRWFSAAIMGLMLLMLVLFMNSGVFFIREIYVGGTRYLTPPEIFQRSGLANMHIFWVDPAVIETQLEADPAIANAKVEIGWPPNMVQITVMERQPALIWVQSGQQVWVDLTGRVMQLRQDVPNLVKVIVEKPTKTIHLSNCPLQGLDEVLGPGSCIDASTVAGVLQFKALYPNAQEIVYDPVKGLGYHDGRGWVLWFGDGVDIDTKMRVYDQIVENTFVKNGIQLIEVNVADPDLAYYVPVP